MSETNAINVTTPERRLPLVGRIAIMVVAATLIWLSVGAIVESLLGAEYTRQSHLLRTVLTSALALPLVVLARHFLDQRLLAGLGLPALRTGWKPLLIGMFCWLLPAGVGTLACLLFGWVEVTLSSSPSDVLQLTVWLAIMVFFYEALPEELIFRGYVYRNLAAQFPLWAAVVGQAALFTLWGILNGGANSLDRSLLFFTFSVILGIFRAITGSIWAGIGFHVIFQTFAQLFGTVGGQFVITSPALLTGVAFGALPFAVGISLLRLFYKQRPNWHAIEPDPPAA